MTIPTESFDTAFARMVAFLFNPACDTISQEFFPLSQYNFPKKAADKGYH